MKNITRSEFVEAALLEYLNSSAPYLTINLYSSEIQKILRDYPQLEVKKGRKTMASPSDKRYYCIISHADDENPPKNL